MARKPRISFPGALHHILIRGNHKEAIFLCDRDRKRFINLIGQYHEKYSFKCYAYVLMENHIHLLIEEGNISLSRIMQGINQSYTQYFNARYEKVGHLFQGRYKAILCDSNEYLLALIRYIHLNPVRALLVRKPEEYRWSSHKAYISEEGESFIDKDFVLSQFADREKEASKMFVEFIHDAIGEKPPSDFNNGNYLGGKEFIENLDSDFASPQKDRVPVALSDICLLVSRKMTISKNQLKSKSQMSQLCKARAIVYYIARELGERPLNDIAGYFNRSISTISESISQIQKKMETDRDLQVQIEELSEQLRNFRNSEA